MTGKISPAGDSGGFAGSGDQQEFTAGADLIDLVGASNVTLDHVTVRDTLGSAIGVSWGSHHDTFTNLNVDGVGGMGLILGGGMNTKSGAVFQTDTSVLGLNTGPSTPSWNSGGMAQNAVRNLDYDCCHTLSDVRINDVGRVYTGSSCISMDSWSRITFDHVTASHCAVAGLSAQSSDLVDAATYDYDGATYETYYASGFNGTEPVWLPWDYGDRITNSEFGPAGGQFAGDGTWVPGANGGSDLAVVYMQADFDGDMSGDATGAPLIFDHNWVHDGSGAAWQTVNETGSISNSGVDFILLYTDGNQTNGIVLTTSPEITRTLHMPQVPLPQP